MADSRGRDFFTARTLKIAQKEQTGVTRASDTEPIEKK